MGPRSFLKQGLSLCRLSFHDALNLMYLHTMVVRLHIDNVQVTFRGLGNL